MTNDSCPQQLYELSFLLGAGQAVPTMTSSLFLGACQAVPTMTSKCLEQIFFVFGFESERQQLPSTAAKRLL